LSRSWQQELLLGSQRWETGAGAELDLAGGVLELAIEVFDTVIHAQAAVTTCVAAAAMS
jgi:hypothetical protein